MISLLSPRLDFCRAHFCPWGCIFYSRRIHQTSCIYLGGVSLQHAPILVELLDLQVRDHRFGNFDMRNDLRPALIAADQICRVWHRPPERRESGVAFEASQRSQRLLSFLRRAVVGVLLAGGQIHRSGACFPTRRSRRGRKTFFL